MEIHKYIETLYSKAVSTGELGHEVCELRSHSKISEFIMLYCMLSKVMGTIVEIAYNSGYLY